MAYLFKGLLLFVVDHVVKESLNGHLKDEKNHENSRVPYVGF